MKGVSAGHTVAMIVTFSVNKMTTRSPIIGHLFHFTIWTSSERNVFQKIKNTRDRF